MSRVVYVGGFSNGRSSVERVAVALGNYYDEVDAFTFSTAISSPETIRKAVYNVNVVTHSAGMLTIVGTCPERIDAFGPPVPTAKLKLIGRSAVKMARLYTPGAGIHSLRELPVVSRHSRSSAADMFAHPVRNIGTLNAISQFDAVDAAIAAQASDIPVTLGYTNGDEYFRFSAEQEAQAHACSIDIVRLSGIHDELVIRPAETLSAYYALRPENPLM